MKFQNVYGCSINLKIKKGELFGIVGVVGSGKSSLASALIGEMVKISGKVNLYVSYCCWKVKILNI